MEAWQYFDRESSTILVVVRSMHWKEVVLYEAYWTKTEMKRFQLWPEKSGVLDWQIKPIFAVHWKHSVWCCSCIGHSFLCFPSVFMVPVIMHHLLILWVNRSYSETVGWWRFMCNGCASVMSWNSGCAFIFVFMNSLYYFCKHLTCAPLSAAKFYVQWEKIW